MTRIIETLKDFANKNIYKGGQYYYIIKMDVIFAEGAFTYEMDARYMNIEANRFIELMKDCTNNLKSVKVRNVFMDNNL